MIYLIFAAALILCARVYVRKSAKKNRQRFDWNFLAHTAMGNGSLLGSGEQDSDGRAQALLKKTCDHFGMDTAFVRLENGILLQENFGAEPFSSQDDYIYSYAKKNSQIMDVPYLGVSLWRNHTQYLQSNFERYIAVPIIVDGKREGTICFIGRKPSHQMLTSADKELLSALAEWVGRDLYAFVQESSGADEASLVA